MSAPDENGWVPIETAPKDGTRILVYRRGGGRIYPKIEIDWWSDKYTKPCWAKSSPIEQPSHWQPLPKPPANPHEGG